MAVRLFDRIMIIDWSAARKRSVGKDSIWIADSHAETTNLATRALAMAHVSSRIKCALQDNQRLLIGWDFAFGYPSGFAGVIGGGDWASVWKQLADTIEDTPDNHSNHFDIAAAINQSLGLKTGPFWGCTYSPPPTGLERKRYPEGVRTQWPYPFRYERLIETQLKQRKRPASSVFQLAYSGCVGSQTLLGIARLEGLRREFAGQIAIWPFETGFSDNLSAPVVLAEIYPSAHEIETGPEVKDRRQVESVLRDFRHWNESDRLRAALSAPGLTGAAREQALKEEGWIVGQ